jgi:hypothetical protein
VRFQVLTAASMMFRFDFWDILPCRTSETSVDNHFTRQYIPEDNSEHHILISVAFTTTLNTTADKDSRLEPRIRELGWNQRCFLTDTAHSVPSKAVDDLVPYSSEFTSSAINYLCIK